MQTKLQDVYDRLYAELPFKIPGLQLIAPHVGLIYERPTCNLVTRDGIEMLFMHCTFDEWPQPQPQIAEPKPLPSPPITNNIYCALSDCDDDEITFQPVVRPRKPRRDRRKEFMKAKRMRRQAQQEFRSSLFCHTG